MLASYTLFYLWVCYSGFLIPFETFVGAAWGGGVREWVVKEVLYWEALP